MHGSLQLRSKKYKKHFETFLFISHCTHYFTLAYYCMLFRTCVNAPAQNLRHGLCSIHILCPSNPEIGSSTLTSSRLSITETFVVLCSPSPDTVLAKVFRMISNLSGKMFFLSPLQTLSAVSQSHDPEQMAFEEGRPGEIRMGGRISKVSTNGMLTRKDAKTSLITK